MAARSEFVVVIAYPNGKTGYLRFGALKWAQQKAAKLAAWASENNITIEIYKESFIGNSFKARTKVE